MAARQSRRQLQFTGFEMGMIGVSFVVTVTVVFFLGLFVGKRNASWHAPAEDRIARVPVDDFTRYKRPAPIEKPVRETKPADAPPAATAAAPTGPAAKPTPAEAATPAAAAAAAAAPVGATVAGPGATDATRTPPAVPDAAAKESAKARELAAAKEAAAKEAAAKKAKEEKDLAETSTGKGYTVQILATRKQAEADALVQKLKSRGYAAYIRKVSDGAGAWYRVRVGSYGAFSEAKGMAEKCRRDLSLGQAFVSTE